jgi:hypothetical protein
MELYHFTSSAHLRGIHKFGLTVGDVVTDIERLDGRIAVWLTSSPSADGHGLGGSAVDKTEFRLTVEVPEDERLVRWVDWALGNATELTRRRLVAAGGHSSETWYLFFGWLPPSLITEVISTRTALSLDNWGEYLSEDKSLRGVSFEGRHAWQNRLFRDFKHRFQPRAHRFEKAASISKA